MILEEYIKSERNDKISTQIIEELRKIPNSDDDLVLAVLVYLKDDITRKMMLEYLQKGENVTYTQVTLNALWLNQNRDKLNIR